MNNHPPHVMPVLLDIGPAVHQNAGLARYTERLASHLLQRREAGRAGLPPAPSAAVPTGTLPTGMVPAVTIPAGLPPETSTPDLSFFYNAHSGHRPPAALATAPTYTLPLGQYPWRLSVLASQLARMSYWPITSILHQVRAAAGNSPGPAIYHAVEHLLPRLPGPTVLTVHDLIFERYPQHHTRLNTLYLHTAMPLFVRAATAIIAVSRHTKRDLVELYGVASEKIHVVYEGVDERFAPAAPDAVERVHTQYSPNRPFLLMVGTLEPRKNHITALHALARLKANGAPHRLLIAGGKGWLFEPVQALVDQLGLAGDVVFCGYVPDADLPPLYTAADCVLVPSLYEGFGFPVLEAMACGGLVVCSNVSSLPEVAGDAALLVPPEDDAALANAVHLLLTQPALAEHLRTHGLINARRFRWDRCADETAAVYATISALFNPSAPN